MQLSNARWSKAPPWPYSVQPVDGTNTDQIIEFDLFPIISKTYFVPCLQSYKQNYLAIM